jgi:enterochelin esterase-like enzyme
LVGAPWRHAWAGRVETLVIDSEALTANPLADPHRRPLLVYLPPGYDDDPGRRYPVIYRLQSLANQVDMWLNRRAFRPNPVEALDALFAAGSAPPVIVVHPDAWTSLGGSQFLDSPGTGRYHTYLCDEVVPLVDARFRTLADREHRGLAGTSSGGYGAMVNAMLRPDLFSAFASHAGDALFEACYAPAFGDAARALSRDHGGSHVRFLDDWRARSGRSRPGDDLLLNLVCMAACYSTDLDGSLHLPFEPDTGRLVPAVWQRWLERDPVRMAPLHADALRSMRAIWIDAGRSDEFHLDLGALAFVKELAALGLDRSTVHFELFEGGHGGLEWRFPLAIGWLAERLTG